MDFNTLDWLLALAPPVVVLGLMVVLGWDSSRAGVAGWLAAAVIAVGRFGAGAQVLGVAQVEALILAADVSLIVWAALLLYQTVERAGALAVVAEALARLSADRLIQTLLLGWVFASFLQGIGGFGVPVAIVAPLLIGLGVSRDRAVVIPALGHSWAVTFGSLGVPFVVLVKTVDLPGERLAGPSALLLGALGYAVALMAAHALEGRAGMPRAAVCGLSGPRWARAACAGGEWLMDAWRGRRGAGGVRCGGGLASLARARGPAQAYVPTPVQPSERPRPAIALPWRGVILIALALPLRGSNRCVQRSIAGRWRWICPRRPRIAAGMNPRRG